MAMKDKKIEECLLNHISVFINGIYDCHQIQDIIKKYPIKANNNETPIILLLSGFNNDLTEDIISSVDSSINYTIIPHYMAIFAVRRIINSIIQQLDTNEQSRIFDLEFANYILDSFRDLDTLEKFDHNLSIIKQISTYLKNKEIETIKLYTSLINRTNKICPKKITDYATLLEIIREIKNRLNIDIPLHIIIDATSLLNKFMQEEINLWITNRNVSTMTFKVIYNNDNWKTWKTNDGFDISYGNHCEFKDLEESDRGQRKRLNIPFNS